jgi:hypothetical protein
LKKAELDRLRTLSPHALAHLEHAYDLELPFTSNAIEGNTLTQIETSLMIEQGEPLRQYGSRDVSISFAGASSSAEWAIARLGWVQHRRSRKQRLHATLAEYLTALHEALPPPDPTPQHAFRLAGRALQPRLTKQPVDQDAGAGCLGRRACASGAPPAAGFSHTAAVRDGEVAASIAAWSW